MAGSGSGSSGGSAGGSSSGGTGGSSSAGSTGGTSYSAGSSSYASGGGSYSGDGGMSSYALASARTSSSLYGGVGELGAPGAPGMGRPGSIYGNSYNPEGAQSYNPLSSPEGKEGNDGASLMADYFSKDIANLLTSYMGPSYGIDSKAGKGRHGGKPSTDEITNGLYDLGKKVSSNYRASRELPGMPGDDSEEKYDGKEKDDEPSLPKDDRKPCMLGCGRPAMRGSPFCAPCLTGRN